MSCIESWLAYLAIPFLACCGSVPNAGTDVPVELGSASDRFENWYVDTWGHYHRDLVQVEMVSRTADAIVVRIGSGTENISSFVEVRLEQVGPETLSADLGMSAFSHLVAAEPLPVHDPKGWVRVSSMNLRANHGFTCEFGIVGEWQSEPMYARGQFFLQP